MPRIQCERCGFEWELNSSKQKTLLCNSCRAVKVRTVHTKRGKCLPWHGSFATDQATPVGDDGLPVLPGVRGCGHNDCVNPSHITKREIKMIRNESLIELTGWLNDMKEFEWGTALKVSVDVRKKTVLGEWETVDKTVYDVTTDGRTPLEGVKQVKVTGRITGTSTFQKRDGSTGAAIKVRAESVEPVSDKVNEAAIHAVWPTVNPVQSVGEGAPF